MQNGKINHLQLYEDLLLITLAFGAADGPPAVGPGDLPKSLETAEKAGLNKAP